VPQDERDQFSSDRLHRKRQSDHGQQVFVTRRSPVCWIRHSAIGTHAKQAAPAPLCIHVRSRRISTSAVSRSATCAAAMAVKCNRTFIQECLTFAVAISVCTSRKNQNGKHRKAPRSGCFGRPFCETVTNVVTCRWNGLSATHPRYGAVSPRKACRSLGFICSIPVEIISWWNYAAMYIQKTYLEVPKTSHLRRHNRRNGMIF
jgi:hypothetical protein